MLGGVEYCATERVDFYLRVRYAFLQSLVYLVSTYG